MAVAGTSLNVRGQIQLDARLSTDPDDGDSLSYRWLVEGEYDYRIGQTLSVADLEPGDYLAILVVEDERGETYSDSLHFALTPGGEFEEQDLIEAYNFGLQEGRLQCSVDPLACGFDFTPIREVARLEGYEQGLDAGFSDGYEQGLNAGKSECIDDPVHCNLYSQQDLDDALESAKSDMTRELIENLPTGQLVCQCRKQPTSLFCAYLHEQDEDKKKPKSKDKGKGKGKGTGKS